jgi:hypothetical protein
MLDADATDHDSNDDSPTEDANQVPDWTQPLQTLSGIHGVRLEVEWVGGIADLDHPCIALWLKQYGQLISHLTVEVHVSAYMLKLREFAEAAAPCRSIDLTILHSPDQVVDLSELEAVVESLQSLICEPGPMDFGTLRGLNGLNSMSQLTALHLANEDFGSEEPWGVLARLTRLQQLELAVSATGDPSPLSALTGLSSLHLNSFREPEANGPAPFSFSSLQPLSTLQQLEVLHLRYFACAATSLQGLVGLSSLRRLAIADYGAKLRKLDGISPGLVEVCIDSAPGLEGLAGIEGCTSMEKLSLNYCGVSSLQPLRGLNSLKELRVTNCNMTSLEGLISVPLESLSLKDCRYLVQLSGIGHVSALRSLEVEECGVISLQPLSKLGKALRKLRVLGCGRVQEEVLDLPHVQSTVDLDVMFSKVKEVVLAGGVRRVVPA